MPNNEDQSDFAKAIDAWRHKHSLRDDEPLLLCLDLFRIHQEHWDSIRRQDFPAFTEFRADILRLHSDAITFQRQATSLGHEMRRLSQILRLVAQTNVALVLTTSLALLTGLLIGKYLL